MKKSKIPFVIEGNLVPNLASMFIDAYAVTLYPFVFIRPKKKDIPAHRIVAEEYSRQRTLHHEKIHIIQYKEMWVLGLMFMYLYDWVHGLIKYKDPAKAYFRIRVEQEAYAHQHKFQFYMNGEPSGETYEKDYYLTREPFAWKQYKV